MTDLTGANSKILMTFPFAISPIELQDFRVEQAVVVSSPDLTVSTFNLGGQKKDSKVFNEKLITINFLATSPSIDLFIRWDNEMDLQERALNNGIFSVSIFNIGKKFVYSQCSLKNLGMSTIQSTLGEVEIIMSCHPSRKVITL